jgi:hypothetical protein
MAMSLNPNSRAVALMLVLLTTLLPVALNANDDLQGEVRFQPAEQDLHWVGQELELQLELWTDGFSFSDQLFVLPEVKGAYLLQPDSTTVKLNEDRNGVQWQGLRYQLLLYPQREGRLEVPSFDISFAARAGFGTEPAQFRYRTEPLLIEARLPPGVTPGSLLVTTSSFTMESSWDPDSAIEGLAELKVGDAITLSVTRSAEDVPGMIFEPLPEIVIDGLAVYPKTPKVNDQVDRGSLTGERVDSVTFVCQREGSYRIPEFRFQWWDPRREVLSENRVESLELNVIANPAYAVGAGRSAASGVFQLSWSRLLAILAGLVVLVFAGRIGLIRLKGYLQQRRASREAGEAWAFRQVGKACESGNAGQAYNAITLWLGRVNPGGPAITLTGLAAECDSESLKNEATALQESVASGSNLEWKGSELARLLAEQRKGSGRSVKSVGALLPLNPR